MTFEVLICVIMTLLVGYPLFMIWWKLDSVYEELKQYRREREIERDRKNAALK